MQNEADLLDTDLLPIRTAEGIPPAVGEAARRAAQHVRLSSADDACEHLYILTVRSSLGPSPPHAGRYTVASRFRCRSCERGYIFSKGSRTVRCLPALPCRLRAMGRTV